MESPQLFSSESLLKKAEKNNGIEYSQETIDTVERLKKPFENVKTADGKIDIDIEGQTLHVEIGSVDEGDTEDISNFTYDLISQNKYDPSIEFKKINTLSFKHANGEFDVLSLIPREYIIYYYPTISMNIIEYDGSVDGNRKAIYIAGDICSPLTLAILFHEMGHVVDFGRLEKLGVRSLVTPHEYHEQAETLRKEKTASAFAISLMRQHLEDTTLKKDIVSFLKDYALQSYNLSVNTEIGGQEMYKAQMNSEWGDYESLTRQEEETRMYLDAWEKWQKTEQYQKWKQGLSPEDLGWAEFGVWREWVETSGYEYWNDYPEEERNPFPEIEDNEPNK